MEDSLLMNNSAIEKGLFRAQALKKYIETIKKNPASSQTGIFMKPDRNKVDNLKDANYDKLTEEGFADVEAETNIYFPTPENPFVVTNDMIITPVCTRGYTGAQIISMVLEELMDKSNIRDPYGISADPKFVFDGQWCYNDDNHSWKFETNNSEDYTKIIKSTDVTIYSVTDEFEKAFGFKRNEKMQNVQTRIMNLMGVTSFVGPDLFYTKAIEYMVWNFPTDRQKVFILITMDDKELDAVKKNIRPEDIIVVIRSYNEVAYPPQKLFAPYSESVYKCFYKKIKQYFVKG
jgi:hypothetical protein